MLVDDKPAAPNLLINVGHPHGEVELLALLVGAGHALNAMAVGKVAVGADVEVVRSTVIGPSKLPRKTCQSLG
jgi:hypothetical protein